MEARKNINQLVKPAAPAAANVEEIANNEYILSFGVFDLDGTNHKAREVDAPAGKILISYDSKVELISRGDVNGEYMNIEFISKYYNSYSVTTAKHQSRFLSENYFYRWEGVVIYLPDETAQRLFNAAVTNPEAAERIKAAAIKQYETEARTLQYLQEQKEAIKNADNINLEGPELINGLIKQGAKVTGETWQELKTVNNHFLKMELNNIKFIVKETWKDSGNIKAVRLQKIQPTYKSVLIE